jgi:hypothetical protein
MTKEFDELVNELEDLEQDPYWKALSQAWPFLPADVKIWIAKIISQIAFENDPRGYWLKKAVGIPHKKRIARHRPSYERFTGNYRLFP